MLRQYQQQHWHGPLSAEACAQASPALTRSTRACMEPLRLAAQLRPLASVSEADVCGQIATVSPCTSVRIVNSHFHCLSAEDGRVLLLRWAAHRVCMLSGRCCAIGHVHTTGSPSGTPSTRIQGTKLCAGVAAAAAASSCSPACAQLPVSSTTASKTPRRSRLSTG